MRIRIWTPRIFGEAILAAILIGTPAMAQITNNASAQAQVATGQHVGIDGELEILHQDFSDGHSRVLYSLKRADGSRVPLQFSKQPPTHLLTGARVHADGQLSGGNLVLYSGAQGSTSLTTTTSGSSSTPSIPLPNTFGPQSTLVILVNFQDNVIEPYTVTDAQNAFFVNANNFIFENSYGQASITGAVVGWYTIPESVTTCNTYQISADAQNAAVAAGVNLSNYTRFVYAFPQNGACGFGGASNVGGNPSQSWINGTTGAGGTTLDLHVIDHELGHAFGLWHSHLFDCDTAATICSNPTIDEYGDILDTMGPPQPPSPQYNAFQKERLGWLNYGASPSIQTVTSSSTYTINPYEIAGPGPNALKILKSTNSTTGAKTWYYLEARQAIGFDEFLTDGTRLGQNETAGVLFHVGTDNDGNTGDLLDMTPATLTYYFWFDPSLAMGQSFSDSSAGVTFTTESATSAGATVNVQFSGSGSGTSSTTGTPVLAVATNQTTYTPGQTVSVTATATSGGKPVPNVSVKFDVTSSTGNQIAGSATTGKNGIAVYKLRLKQSAPAGTYNAGAAATVQSNTLSANAAFLVQ